MHTINDEIEIAATPARIHEALTTKDGIQGWWTLDTDVAADAMAFRFERQSGPMEVRFRVDRSDAAGVAMTCVGMTNNPDWLGTRLSFALAGDGARTRVELVHSGYPARNEVFDQCVKGWAFFLGSLKRYLETGTGEPYARPTRSIVDAIDIAAAPAKVLAALTTGEGIAAWWTVDNTVDAERHVYRFGKGDDRAVETFRVEACDARGLALVCIEEDHGIGWLNTRLRFSLEASPAGGTRVALTHAGFQLDSGCYDECTSGWRHFLGSLKAYLETQKGTPHVPAAGACH